MASDASQVSMGVLDFKPGDASPQELFRLLNSLVTDYLSSAEAAKALNRGDWIYIINVLTESTLSFPVPVREGIDWSIMDEKIQFVQTTVEIISRVFTKVDGIYQGFSEPCLKQVFCRLLDTCFILDLFIEVDDVARAGLPSPSSLRRKVLNVLVEVLRGFGNAACSSETQGPYILLRLVGHEIIRVNQVLTSPTAPLPFPLSIKWFQEDCVEEFEDTVKHISSDPQPNEENTKKQLQNMIVETASQVPTLLATVLEVAFSTFFPTLPSSLFLQDIQSSLLETLKAFVNYCMSPSSSTTNIRRSRVLAASLQLHRHLVHPEKPSEVQTFHYIVSRLAQARMEGMIQAELSALDRALVDYLDSSSIQPVRSLIIQSTNALNSQDGAIADVLELAVSYLKCCITSADEEACQLISDELKECVRPEANLIRAQIEQLAGKSALVPSSTQASTKLKMKEHIWRKEIRKLVQTVISPEPLAWMDDDFRPNETHFIRRVLNDICDRFGSPVEKSDEASRLELAARLAKLPCLLTLCSSEDCSKFRKSDEFSMVHLYLPAMEALLQGTNEEVTPAVRRGVYKALRPILRHRNEADPGQQVLDLIFRGLSDKDRSTRLQAGSALQAVIDLYPGHAASGNPSAAIFDRVYQHIDTSRGPMKETMIVSVGKWGMTRDQDVLGNVLCLLVAQLGRPNILVRSLACAQILALSKYHNKTPWPLILPFIDRVAPFVVNRLCTEPTLWQEFSKLMAVNPQNFFVVSQSKTIPDLLVRCDAQGLEIVARFLGKEPHSLIIGENIHLHLAPIFLLRSPSATTKSINFVLGILNEASGTKIDLRHVLPGCTTSLLTELVIMMGDENPEVNAQAITAIQKVEAAIETGHSLPSQGQGCDPSQFLASQMLGIISRILEMLQDVHGKKTVFAKQRILRSLGALIVLIGLPIRSVASQIMAAFQTMVTVPELSEVTIEGWHKFLTTLGPAEFGPHLGATCAAFVCAWPNLSEQSRRIVCESLHHTFSQHAKELLKYLNEIVNLSVVAELRSLHDYITKLRGAVSPRDILCPILARCLNNNLTVATLSISELRQFLQTDYPKYIPSLATGDFFDPTIGHLLSTLYKAACRDGEGAENLRLLAYECIGIVGAVDPYRFEVVNTQTDMVVIRNFTDEGETVAFVLHLIQDLLVDAFRSTSDLKYQTNLAYPIQELLKLCGFSLDLVNSGRAAPVKIRNRWSTLSKDVLDVIAPLLVGRFTFNHQTNTNVQVPVYPTQSTYREWLQLWTTYLIPKVFGKEAQQIFSVFLSVVRSKDVLIAKHLLPHIVLNILISGNPVDKENIRNEIMAVLEDQLNPDSTSTTDKKLLSAQAIFALLDHLNRWIRVVRQQLNPQKKRARSAPTDIDEQVLRLDSMISSINRDLMARAAFQCKAFARSLMSFELQALTLQQQKSCRLQEYYDRIHEIYAHLDEPDGMEGVSSMILSPSLEHKIREHESTGKWTAAQSCWEVRLQQSPDNFDYHLGLLRCLRNLGHYHTMRNHVKGVLTSHPEWESDLADFHVESSWMVGDWDDIQSLLEGIDVRTPAAVLAKVLLAMRKNDQEEVSSSLAVARRTLGAPITATGADGYRLTYDSVLNLHMTRELELVYNVSRRLSTSSSHRRKALADLSTILTHRLDSTLPTFRCREPILSTRRVGFSLMPSSYAELKNEVGSTWLASAKIARKAGHWQTAYSAMLQARQTDHSLYFIESAKLTKADGDPLRALYELDTSMQTSGFAVNSSLVDLTIDEETAGRIKGKLYLLRARWMNESERYDAPTILDAFSQANDLGKNMESSHFYFGNFYDKCAKELKPSEIIKRGIKMTVYIIRNYAKAIRLGSKYIYHTVPRLLTLWLDNGEDVNISGTEVFNKINEIVAIAIKEIPAYKWFTAFPQIVSRVGHKVDKVYRLLAQLTVSIMQEYPQQGLWLFASVAQSTKQPDRAARGLAILDQLRSSPSSNRKLSRLVGDSVAMTKELLEVCNFSVDENTKSLSIARSFKNLRVLGNCDLIVPLQTSLTVNLPPSSSAEGQHQPFPVDAPTFKGFADEIEVMKSLAKPRKITIQGSDGQIYMFLGKPKDDLRKDARLMDFNSIINKLLKTNSDARRRQLHIRTYGVVTLNEECGFIQWVPNTIPIRPILINLYEARRVRTWTSEMGEIFKRIKYASDAQAVELFTLKILPAFEPVFHEWFIETFPEPSAWLTSRLNYARTSAVMCMVGYILGLGDRHTENILLDVNTGDAIHVDFNCLFEKGKLLETPELVPFRLTQNVVDGLGITGVEGVFRIACELTMNLLRENKDSLMSVLDAFIHDPLVEWEDEKRKRDRTRNQPKASTASIAKNALEPIGKKLEGWYDVKKGKHEHTTKQLSTKHLVESLILAARDQQNLAKMYPGWSAWY